MVCANDVQAVCSNVVRANAVSLEPFVEEQQQLRELAAKSILPVFELDVTRQGADDVADWLDERGLLTL